jgi:hypothetical protein
MRPWKLASETATLDNLSNGRVILAVGLGAVDTGFAEFGEVTDRKQRAELLDEGLDILTGLWRGQPFSYTGKHYTVKPTSFMPPPPTVQQPHIPIWVVGAWPSTKSMQRVLRYDGLLPAVLDKQGKVSMSRATPDEIRAMKFYIEQNRTETTPFDIIVEGETPSNDRGKSGAIVRPYEEAGATWWIESMWTKPEPEKLLARLQSGPPGNS